VRRPQGSPLRDPCSCGRRIGVALHDAKVGLFDERLEIR
jgi:hypothetical protein